MKEFLRHSFQFGLIFATLLIAVFLLSFFKNYTLRFYISALVSIFYVLVGTLHHNEEKNLRLNHVLEYLAIGTLIFIILVSIFK